MRACKRFVYDEQQKKVVQVPLRRPAPGEVDPWRKHVSIGAGVHSSQVEEHRQFIRERGLTGVEVLPTGDVKMDSSRAQYEYLKARGMHNNDGNR